MKNIRSDLDVYGLSNAFFKLTCAISLQIEVAVGFNPENFRYLVFNFRHDVGAEAGRGVSLGTFNFSYANSTNPLDKLSIGFV